MPVTKLMTMKKPLLLALLATGACCALAVSAIHFEAHAQEASKSCNTECLLNRGRRPPILDPLIAIDPSPLRLH